MINQINYGITPPIKSVSGYRIINQTVTRLSISSGSITDSTGRFQIISNSTVSLNLEVRGINGFDEYNPDIGLPAQGMFRIFVIGDVTSRQPTACIASLHDIPIMPSDYDVFALVGYFSFGAGSSEGSPGLYSAGNNATRKCFYVPMVTPFSASVANEAIRTINLTNFVAPQENTLVNLITNQSIGASTKIIQVGKDLTRGFFNQAKTINSVGANRTNMVCPVSMRMGYPTIDIKFAVAPPSPEILTVSVGWYEFNL